MEEERREAASLFIWRGPLVRAQTEEGLSESKPHMEDFKQLVYWTWLFP
jgi:hypothetical protein